MSGIMAMVLGAKTAIAAAVDEFFNRVTLLLPGDGTNGAQNNTFLDSSSNNFSITRNGNTTQGTFSPFSQTGWSGAFNGTNQYITGTITAVNNTTMTMECWVWFNAFDNTNGNHVIQVDNGTNTNYALTHNTNGVARFLSRNNTGTSIFDLSSSNNTLQLGKWHHVVGVRNSSAASLYVDGTRVATVSSPTVSTTDGTSLNIGSNQGTSRYTNGYISNARIVSGTAIYDPTSSTLTVPTAPLSFPTGTRVLALQTNRFNDASGTITLTTTNNPSIQAFSPFAPTAAYSAATNGGSGYFDGTGDYLSVGAAADWAFLSNSTALWSIEAWFYNTTSGAQVQLFDTNGGSSSGVGLNIVKTSTELLRIFISRGVSASNVLDVTTTGKLVRNSWNHILITYDQSLASANAKIYINGSAAETGNKTANAPSSSNPANALSIATYGAGAGEFYTGYIGSIRISNVVRSSGVPTSPYTSDANTKLLANFTNAGILDATAKNALETVGNAQISTTQSKWGGSSISFDGTGDWLLLPHTVDQMLGTGAFTIEMWVYRNSSGTYGLVGKGTSTTGWLVSLNSSNQVVFTYGSSTITSTGTISATTWTYIAVVREGTGTNQTKIYISGSNDGTGTVSTDFTQTNGMYVGADRTGGSAFNGYIDDLRITKGYARTIATPSSAFALQ